MTTFICFVIAMVILYIMRLLTGGFDITELTSYLLMVLLLGTHVYLSTRKKVIYVIAFSKHKNRTMYFDFGHKH